MLCIYDGILFSLKEEGNSDTCYNWVSLEDTVPSEISQLQKNKDYMIPLTCGIWSCQINKVTYWLPGAVKRENERLLFNGVRVSVLQGEKGLQSHCQQCAYGDGLSRQVVSDSCDPMDCSPPGFSVHGVFQARILEWIAISFSRESSRPRNWTQVSCIAGKFFTDWAMREAYT